MRGIFYSRTLMARGAAVQNVKIHILFIFPDVHGAVWVTSDSSRIVGVGYVGVAPDIF